MNVWVKEKTAKEGRENDEIDIRQAEQELTFYELSQYSARHAAILPSIEGNWKGAMISTSLCC